MNNSKLTRRNTINGYLFILPNIIGFIVFTMIPMVAAFILSFTKWDGFNAPKFIGMQNYIKAFHDSNFIISITHNLQYVVMFVPLTLFMALLIALALNMGLKGIKIYRISFFMPYISATIACVAIWSLLFHPTSGPINSFLVNIGIENPPGWIVSSKWALMSVTIVSIWKEVGYFMVLYLAGLQGIPKVLYEASMIDGANQWQKFRYITIPSLKNITFFLSTMAIIFSFKSFDMVYALTEGGPGRSTYLLVYYIFTESFNNSRFGYSAALSFILFFVIIMFTFVRFQYQKRNQ